MTTGRINQVTRKLNSGQANLEPQLGNSGKPSNGEPDPESKQIHRSELKTLSFSRTSQVHSLVRRRLKSRPTTNDFTRPSMNNTRFSERAYRTENEANHETTQTEWSASGPCCQRFSPPSPRSRRRGDARPEVALRLTVGQFHTAHSKTCFSPLVFLEGGRFKVEAESESLSRNVMMGEFFIIISLRIFKISFFYVPW